MNKKPLPQNLTEEELLEQLNGEATIETSGNEILLFISTYNIQPGKESVAVRLLYRLYKNWSKNLMSLSSFSKEMHLIFNGQQSRLNINQKALKLSKMAQEAFLKKNRPKTKSPHYKAHIELFMKQCGVSKGRFWLESAILFDLYDEWCYSNNRRTQLNVNTLTSLLKIYLKYKRVKNTLIVFAVDKSITKHISNERIENIRKSRKIRNAQKAKDRQAAKES